MAKINSKGMKMAGMDSLSNYSKPAHKTVKGAVMSAKKMTPKMVAQRKKSRISNAASKVMGGLYSK